MTPSRVRGGVSEGKNKLSTIWLAMTEETHLLLEQWRLQRFEFDFFPPLFRQDQGL
jgi:hypothetical protein